jgi:hypothetical protein
MLEIANLIRLGQSSVLTGDLDSYKRATRLVAKTIRNLAEQDRINDALNLESFWYQNLVKQIESEDNYFEAFKWHKDALFTAGAQRRRKFKPRDPNSVAFIVPNGVLLGHTQVLIRVISAWREKRLPASISVVSLTDFSQELASRLNGLSVRLLANGNTQAERSDAIDWCRNILEELRVEVAVWLSVPTWSSYALGYGLAPKQVFWSLKFHPVYLGAEIKHIAMSSPGEGQILINGNPWIRYSPPLTVKWNQRPAGEISRLRTSLGGGFIFGSLARTEKFNSLKFVNAVAEIISQCNGSKFIYTGAQDSALIRRVFADRGLSSSAVYVGWVDTELYSQALDVFLETFPFGCGITGAQAVDFGTRTVSLWCSETLPSYYFENATEAKSASPHWLVTTREDEYITAAVDFFKSSIDGQAKEQRTGILASRDTARSEKLYRLLFNW